MVDHRSARLALLATGDAAALAGLPGQVGEFAVRVRQPRPWVLEVGIERASVVAAGAALWLVAAWLAVGLLAGFGSRLPGTVGRLGKRIGRRLLPQTLLRLVAGSAGLGVLLAPVVAGASPAPAPTPTVSAPSPATAPPASAAPITPPAWPTDAPTSSAAPITPPAWPTSAPASAAAPITPPAWPTSAPASTAAPTPPTRAPTPAGGTVRVRPGDSLWLLAGRRLDVAATDPRIAAEWPRWYAANRGVIGDDPALITPGQVLHAPTPTPEETR